MNRILILVVLLSCFFTVNAQKISANYLFYGYQNKEVIDLNILSEDYAIIWRQNPYMVCLIDKERQICDTLKGANGYQSITVTGANTFTLMQMNSTTSYCVKNGKIECTDGYYYSRFYEPENKCLSLFDIRKIANVSYGYTLLGGYLVAGVENAKVKGNWGFGYRAVNPVNSNVIEIVQPPRKKTKLIDRNKGLPFRFVYHDNKVYINKPTLNMCYIFDANTQIVKKINFPESGKLKNASYWYFYDHQQKKEYVVKFTSGKNIVFELNNNKLAYAGSCKHKPLGIVNGKIHVANKFEGSLHHYLIPMNMNGTQENMILMEDITIN